MKRLLLSTAVLAWVMAAIPATAVPALAQEAAPQAPGSAAVAMPNGEPPLPSPDEYVLREDGTITVGGDAGTNCVDFARDVEQGNIRPGEEELAQSVLAQCEQAGFLSPSDGTAPVEAPTGQAQQYQQPATEAQDSGAAIAVSPGEAPPEIPYFAYNGDGTVTIDGDVGTSCYDFAQTEEGIARSGELENLAQSVLEQCEQDGALSPDNRYAAFPPDQRQQLAATQAEELNQGQRPTATLAEELDQGQQAPATQVEELPATGGPGLPLAVLAAGASLVGLGGLMKLSRR